MASKRGRKEQPASSNASISLEEQVRKRAYEIYLGRNGGPGSELDDWLQAEKELKALIAGLPSGN